MSIFCNLTSTTVKYNKNTNKQMKIMSETYENQYV